MIQGIADAAQLGRVVINLSVGSTRPDSLLADTVLAAVRSGALIVAASGNFGANSAPTYPADLPHVLTVAATDHTGLAAPFSSASDGVDLAAPGVGISAAVPFRYTVDGYQFLNGTSFSTPIVSGAAALVWTVRSDLDSGQIFDLLRSSAIDIAPRGFDPETRLRDARHPGRARTHRRRVATRRSRTTTSGSCKPGGLFASGIAPLTSRAAHERLRARIASTASRIRTTSIACGFRRTATWSCGRATRRSACASGGRAPRR